MSEANEIMELSAEKREDLGTGAARELRRSGRAPAVLYSKGSAAQHLSVDIRELRAFARKQSLTTGVISLNVQGKKVKALVKDIQRHPVKDFVLHLDFLKLAAADIVSISIPVEFLNQGICKGIKRGGILNVVRHEVEIKCAPSDIPEKIVVDLQGYDIGESIHVQSVELPKGVAPTIDRNFTIASIAAPGGGATSSEDEDEAAESDSGA